VLHVTFETSKLVFMLVIDSGDIVRLLNINYVV